jgi:glycosyltransferase involved in cell wall biosynthesis
MNPISVIIPTAGNPQLLETALRSVARQTSREHILHEVLVSENRNDRSSEAVCGKFSDLPIRYIFQDPPVSPLLNFDFLFRRAEADFVALLCDDDWWAPGHLHTALAHLSRDSQVVAWFSACFFTDSEGSRSGWIQRTPVLWIAAGRPNFSSVWLLGRQEVLASAWVLTPFHISSMVVRRDALLLARSSWLDSHIYIADRSLQAHLSTLGSILYDPMVDTFIRYHSGAVTQQFSEKERRKNFRAGTDRIVRIGKECGLDFVELWHRYLREIDDPNAEEVGELFLRAMNKDEMVALGFQRLLPPALFSRALRKLQRVFR